MGVLGRARENLRRSWRRSLLYGLVVGLLATFVLAPLFTWLSLQMLALGGAPVATNFDIAGTVASIPGLLAVLTLSLGTAVVALLGLGGHVVLACDAEHGAPRRPLSALRASLAAAPRLLRPPLAWVALYTLVLLPVLATAWDILRAAALGSTENVYLQAVPAGPWGAFGFYAGLVLAVVVCYVLFVRWTFLLHAMLIEGLGLGAAMKRSAALVSGNRRRVLRAVLGIHAGIVLVFAVETLLFRLLVWLCFDVVAGSSEGLTIAFAAILLVVSTVVAAVTAVLATSAASSVATVLYRELGGTIPEAPDAGAALRVPLPRSARGVLLGVGVVFLFALLLAWPRLASALDLELQPPRVTAHRGSSAAAPENTMAAIELAMAEGADYCEIDVLEAKDGAVVVIHDVNLRRLAGRNQNVHDLTGEELQQIDVGAWFGPRFQGQTIPLLRDVIARVKGKMKLNIEIKTHGRERSMPESVVALIHEHDFVEQCTVTSLDMGMLRRVRVADPAIRIGAIVTASIGNVHALDVDFYSVERAFATVPFIRRSHARGREVHVWTANEESTLGRMYDRGVDSVITDHPARAVALRDARDADDDLRAFLVRAFSR